MDKADSEQGQAAGFQGETMAKVMAMKKIPPKLPKPLLASALLAIPDGKLISK